MANSFPSTHQEEEGNGGTKRCVVQYYWRTSKYVVVVMVMGMHIDDESRVRMGARFVGQDKIRVSFRSMTSSRFNARPSCDQSNGSILNSVRNYVVHIGYHALCCIIVVMHRPSHLSSTTTTTQHNTRFTRVEGPTFLFASTTTHSILYDGPE
jgi:hypothetical protein